MIGEDFPSLPPNEGTPSHTCALFACVRKKKNLEESLE